MRGGHDHDLAVVRRIGQRFLVSRHPGRENRLAERLAAGSEGLTLEGAAVLEDEQCLGHAFSPSTGSERPLAMVVIEVTHASCSSPVDLVFPRRSNSVRRN